MVFGRKGVLRELDITQVGHLLQDSREFLRMWHRPDGDATCLIDPAALGSDPAMFGIALVDCVRHGARAWANGTGMTEAEALERIWFGVDAERGSPTDFGREVN